ncbi:MAG TPA: helix-turn-helix domain-containing protein [Mycobacterium sp.]|nr:helix-turn-helix domain-containing protein [Mycobacterium sp.]
MAAAPLEAQIAAIQAELVSRCADLGALVADTVWREVALYHESGRFTRGEVQQDCTENVRFLFAGLTSAAVFDTTAAASSGCEGARAGVPLPTLMAAYRIGCRLIWEEIVALAAQRPDITPEALIRATARIWMAQDVLTDATVSAYRDEATRLMLTQEAERAALVEALIEGRIVKQSTLWEIATLLRIPARGPYVVVAAQCAAVGRSALPGIESKLSSADIASAWRLLPDLQIGLVHVDTDRKFEILTQTLSRVAAAPIGVSSHFGDLTEVSDAVTYARIAMSAERPDGSMLTAFESDPLAIAAVSAPRVMKRISSAVFAGFADLDAHERETLVSTFRAWMACGGSVNTTAETLFCHPNTVRHRLKRIEDRTGLSLHRPRELAELCLAFEIELRLP